MTAPAENASPAKGVSHEPFYDNRVPPYPCPTCADGVLLLRRDTLHIGEVAESRALNAAVGPEIGVGQWRFTCLFECCDANCQETVACNGSRSWGRDPRLPSEPEARVPWRPGMGPPPNLEEQMLRDQAELVHKYQPRHFLPPIEVHTRRRPESDVIVADDFTWIVAQGKRYTFKSGMQANIVRVLYQVWQGSGGRDGSGLSEKAIAQKVGSSADRFSYDC